MGARNEGVGAIRVFSRRPLVLKRENGLQWLIGSPLLSSLNIVSTIQCVHTQLSDLISPNVSKESDEIRNLIPRGFEVVGALVVCCNNDVKIVRIVVDALSSVKNLRKNLYGSENEGQVLIGAVLDLNSVCTNHDLQFFTLRAANSGNLEKVGTVIYEDEPERSLWDKGSLVRCELSLKLPLYCASTNTKDVEGAYTRAVENVECKLRDPQVAYIIETLNKPSASDSQPVIIHGTELMPPTELPMNAVEIETAEESRLKSLEILYFSKTNATSYTSVEEDADKILVSIMFNRSRSVSDPRAPTAEYYPVMEEAKLLVVNLKLEILSYATKNLLLIDMISKLIIPGLIDQLRSLKNKLFPDILTQHPLLQSYHFVPPGFVHPITVTYEPSFWEVDLKQVEVRKSIHLRLGLPFDRPLLRIANAINSSLKKDNAWNKFNSKGSSLFKDVHHGIPSSLVSGGCASLIQGSYEYYHYLQDGFDDSVLSC